MTTEQNKQPIIDAGKYIRQKYLKALAITAVLLFVTEILLVFLIFKYHFAGQFVFLPVVIFSVVYGILSQKAEDAFFQQFSSANNFSFQKRGLPLDLDGSLFFVGHSPVSRDLVSGQFQGTPFVLLNYQYTIGSGKNSSNFVYTVFRLNFASDLPPIFLKSKNCNFGGFFFGDISTEAKEKLKLEGDFDKYFDLWTKSGFEVEALQVFAPDFMQKIQDSWNKFSLEFKNNQIYVYSHHMITKDEELESMYQLIQYLSNKITPFAKEVKSDLEAMNSEYKN